MRFPYILKLFVLFILFVQPVQLEGQVCKRKIGVDTLDINGHQFVFQVKKSVNKEFTNHLDTLLFISRMEKGKARLLLRYELYKWSADCNNEFEDIGTATTEGDKIILFTRFLQKRSDPIPQHRKRIYQVMKDGKLKLIYDKEEQG